MRLKRRAHARREDAAATERDHRPRCRLVQQLAHELLLGRAKRCLAAALELLRNGMPEALGQQLVAVDRLHPERLRELDRDGRLASAHEADQNQRAPRRLGY